MSAEHTGSWCTQTQRWWAGAISVELTSYRYRARSRGSALATCAIFTVIWTWSDFFTPLIYLTDPNLYTVSIALKGFLDATSGSKLGHDVRHVGRHADPAVPGVSLRPEVPGQGHRHHRRQVASTIHALIVHPLRGSDPPS